MLAMATVGRAKYTHARKGNFGETRREGSAPRNLALARVYFVRLTIVIAKIRDYSQSEIWYDSNIHDS